MSVVNKTARRTWDNKYHRVTVRFSPSMLEALRSWWRQSGAGAHMLSGLGPLVDRALACPEHELAEAATWSLLTPSVPGQHPPGRPHTGVSGKYCNVVLPIETWEAVGTYQRRFGVKKTATAVKQLLRLGLGGAMPYWRRRTDTAVLEMLHTTQASQSEIARHIGVPRQRVHYVFKQATGS